MGLLLPLGFHMSCRSVPSYWKDSKEKISMKRASLLEQTSGDRKVKTEVLGHRRIMYKNTGPKLHMSISGSLIKFPMLLIKGIPSSLWWGEHVCARMQGLSSTSFNPDYRFPAYRDVQDTHWQKGIQIPPSPLGRAKHRWQMLEPLFCQWLSTFCSSVPVLQIEKQGVTDTLLSCILLPKLHKMGFT